MNHMCTNIVIGWS